MNCTAISKEDVVRDPKYGQSHGCIANWHHPSTLHTAWMHVRHEFCRPEILPVYRVYIIGGLITSWYSHTQWFARQRWWPINLCADRHKLGMFNTKATGPQSWGCIAPRTICIVWGLIARVLKLIGKDWEKKIGSTNSRVRKCSALAIRFLSWCFVSCNSSCWVACFQKFGTKRWCCIW